jgi:ubiquinone/menaquinone biosynthesis C-methylase UbiE
MNSEKNYVELIKAPWGKMFYDLLFSQLNIPETPRLKILDFGSGLGVTANHYAQWHNVTAIEPNVEMIENRHRESSYIQICGDFEKLADFQENSFDYAFCHNVLEYIKEKEPVLAGLMRVLKPQGILSIIRHNRAGKIFQTAVFQNNPEKAIVMLDPQTNDASNYLGTQYLYSNSYIIELVGRYGGKVERVLGMRAFWALGQNNSVKYTDNWYENMLALERRVADMDEYRQVAFYNHLFIRKY